MTKKSKSRGQDQWGRFKLECSIAILDQCAAAEEKGTTLFGAGPSVALTGPHLMAEIKASAKGMGGMLGFSLSKLAEGKPIPVNQVREFLNIERFR